MKYSYSSNGEMFFGSEESVEDIIIESGVEIGEEIEIGEQVEFIPIINSSLIIDQLVCDALDHAGESAEGWLDGIEKSSLDELQNDLNDVIQKWLVKNRVYPTFYGIENARTVVREK